ncbi:phosphoribosyl-AMP cyclohydrolase [Methanosphaera stadtmanae]|uniref:phosphoribosyl-AMP cyclohydrolase n=1 Tax=Methanosphaera stadtmanae TaxID=2317 RepID=UPI003CCB994C
MIKPNFRHIINGKRLATAIAQDYKTGEVLMVAFIDEEAFNKTIQTRKAHYYSTSRNMIWYKGEESGHIQEIKEVLLDCDEDAIIFKVKQVGGACHTGHYSCFYKKLSDDGEVVTEYEDKVFDPEDVYEK